MFGKSMAISMIISSIRNKMINRKLTLSEKELIDLINEYTDNKFKIQIVQKFGNDVETYYDTELIIEEK